jgi:arylsulfatase A-like enzyme
VRDVRGISGTHAMNGMLIMEGPGIKNGLTLKRVSIVDVAPTILCLMGVETPDDMDGDIITEAIQENYVPSIAVTPKNKTQQTTAVQTPYPYGEEDEQRIEKRLKDLGYL